MPSERLEQTHAVPARPQARRRVWLYGVLVLLVVAAVGYYAYNQYRDSFSNRDYYRVLYEASNRFNENLIKLDRMHEYGESVSSIRSLLPSYTRTESVTQQHSPLDDAERKRNTVTDNWEPYVYRLTGQKLKVQAEDFRAELEFEDILPIPNQGFSQYLFADLAGDVVATVGGERTISVVNLSSISQEIQRRAKQFQFNLVDPEKQQSTKLAGLPTHSSHVDMSLSYGEFRIFVFPFQLATKIHQGAANEPIDRLYLVGLLPKHELFARGSGPWNVSLFVVTLVSLVFIWTMLRLYLLPQHQSIGGVFTNLSLSASHLFFIVIFALSVSFLFKEVLETNKNRAALEYGEQLSDRLQLDLKDVFTQLRLYRPFYQQMISGILLGQGPERDENCRPISSDKGVEYNFSAHMQQALGALKKSFDRFPARHQGSLPSIAVTAKHVFQIQNGRLDSPPSDHSEPCEAAINATRATLFNAFSGNRAGLPIMDFHAGNKTVKIAGKEFKTYVLSDQPPHVAQKILSVFAFNGQGNSILPTIFYQESNALPETFSLSHRDYYKSVRDKKGWNLVLDERQPAFRNVFVQRLLNINNGTRGTTISMPIYTPDEIDKHPDIAEFIIGADVILPSITLARAPHHDFSYMVVERSSGDVLFHNDTERSLVENLYFNSSGKSNLAQWLRAGLDNSSDLSSRLISGYYHGQAGVFAITKTAVNDWALVVFSPDDSLDALMTNLFLYLCVTFLLSILLLSGACRLLAFVTNKKSMGGYPLRLISLLGALMLSANYLFYLLGQIMDVQSSPANVWPWLLPAVGLGIVALVLKYSLFSRRPAPKTDRSRHLFTLMIVVLLLAGHLTYLRHTGDTPIKSLAFHYKQMTCNRQNHERKELINLALSRYPNSITEQRLDPFKLLPLDYRAASHRKDCSDHPSHVSPEDYPNLSTLIGATYVWKWINSHLLTNQLKINYPNSPPYQLTVPFSTSVLIIALMGALMWVWYWFNTRLLWSRLYYPHNFLRHIARLHQTILQQPCQAPPTSLWVRCDGANLSGIGLNLLLRNERTISEKQHEATAIMVDFSQLYRLSPYLQMISKGDSAFPNLKLHVRKNAEESLLDVQLWDIETCLEKDSSRERLLNLIMELKSLALAGKLNSFTIFAGFHSLQRIMLKDSLSTKPGTSPSYTEYLSWAECLMDFNVQVSALLKKDLDKKLFAIEVKQIPALTHLLNGSAANLEKPASGSIYPSSQQNNWATINYILLHAEALYRFKWENCSAAEKLALYHLAKRRRLNPTNVQMIEHLALNGLIKVKGDEIEIINRSFAHFVLHAETEETLHQLRKQGQAGVWNSYRIPLGMLILLVIGGIALTSGESIYIIAASMAGVLGTIASVTNSANLLRNHSSS